MENDRDKRPVILSGSAAKKKSAARALAKNAVLADEDVLRNSLLAAFADPRTWEVQCFLIRALVRIKRGRELLTDLRGRHTQSTIVHIEIGWALAILNDCDERWVLEHIGTGLEFSEGVIKALSEQGRPVSSAVAEKMIAHADHLPINGERGTWTRVYIAKCCRMLSASHPPSRTFLAVNAASMLAPVRAVCLEAVKGGLA
jgi:hypothetical protein